MKNIYIVIVIIICLVIYLFTTSKKEHFIDTSGNIINLSNVNSLDDRVAINTLAQISKSLMDGKLTVPGDINVTSSINTKNLVVSGDKLTIDESGNIKTNGLEVKSTNLIIDSSGNITNKGTLTTSSMITGGDVNVGGNTVISKNANIGGILSAADINILGNVLFKRNFFALRFNNANNDTDYLYADDETLASNSSFNINILDLKYLWYEMGGRICNAKTNKCLTVTGNTLINNNNQNSIASQISCKTVQDYNRKQIFVILSPWYWNHVSVSIVASYEDDIDGRKSAYFYRTPNRTFGLWPVGGANWESYLKMSRIYVG